MRGFAIPVASLFFLAGCAAPPSFRNVVYENVSTTARVLQPYGNVRGRTYNYRFAPGMLVDATRSEPPNPLSRTAGLLGDVDACYHTAFLLKKTQRIPPLKNPVHAPYDIKLLFASPFSKQSTIDTFKNNTGLEDIPENTFAYIRQVDYDITNIRVFEATPEQLTQALKNIKADTSCTVKAKPFGSHVVRRIYVGNVHTFVRWDRGYDVAIGPWKNRIEKL